MSKVIMLGGEGVGKSILLTVLAQTYRTRNNADFFLEAKNKDAALFCHLNWHLLTEKHEWPPPTPPGAYKKLLWQLHIAGEPARTFDLICSDFAGETFRRVFGNDDTSSPDAAELTAHIRTADAVLVLINLAFLLDEKDIERRIENDWAIKNCIDKIAAFGGKRYCVVFTQIDRYYNLFEQVNNNCRQLLDKYFPQIAGVYPDIDIIPVAAVNRTDLAPGDGENVREVPAKGFCSHNLNEIMKWISETPAVQSTDVPETTYTFPPPMPLDPVAHSAKRLWQNIQYSLYLFATAVVFGLICLGSNSPVFGIISVFFAVGLCGSLLLVFCSGIDFARAKYARRKAYLESANQS